MTLVTWTRERPTTPGWYWYRSPIGGTPAVVLLQYNKVWCTGINGGGPISGLDGEWCGPLEVPG